MSIDIDGPVHYVDYGGEGQPPLVLVHGIGGSQLNWMLVAPALADHFHVVALDLVGFGMTPLAGRNASIGANHRILARFIDGVVGGPVTLAGHSMGGVIGMLTAAADPGLVSRLILVDAAYGIALASPVARTPGWMLDGLAAIPAVGTWIGDRLPRIQGPDRVVRDSLARLSAPGALIDPALVAAHIQQERRRMAMSDPYVGFLQAWNSLHRLRQDLGRWDQQLLPRIVAPTLVVHGSLDPTVPYANADRLLRLRPDWSAVRLDGVGHNPQIEAPERFVAVVLDWTSATASVAT
jgi:pimeloyl-ACP methyl ester carboxylesterase